MNQLLIIYLRLSLEDKQNFDESNSITNQRLLIHRHIKQYNLDSGLKIKEYVDDGYSGKILNRPGMQEMLEEIRRRRVAMIIVKDFSRMGRDHIIMGDFIDKIFPFMGIRFIAINNQYDSDNYKNRTPNLDIPFQNLIYDYYSEENSVKIKNSFSKKWERGEYFGGIPPYGYKVNEAIRGHLLRDWVSGGIVRWIFHKRYYGKLKKCEIRDILNAKEIPSPGEYLRRKGYKLAKARIAWTSVMVTHVLQNPVHIGIVEGGKRDTAETGSKAALYVPKENWLIKWNRHKPTVSLEVFMGVQEMDGVDVGYLQPESDEVPRRKIVYPPPGLKKTIKNGNHIIPDELRESPVKGKIYCGGCGYAMQRKRYTHKTKGMYYLCLYLKLGNENCAHGLIFESDIEEITLKAINYQIMQANKMKEFYKRKEALLNREQENQKKNKKKLMDQLTVLKNKSMEFYEQFREEKITREQFLSFKERLNAQKEQIDKEISKLEQTEGDPQPLQQNKFVEVFGDQEPVSALTRELAELLVERINIYGNKKIVVIFKFADEYQQALQIMQADKENEVCLNG